ncbi:MAG TPA: ribbon-helix-helix domain-containing protein [Pararhizobium sp.]|nr:ribbon-helix-helix domain-containing protein [Pararhizobium sp.]
MRTLIDIGENEIRALDELARKQRQSRAALIRQAVRAYLDKRAEETAADAFGLWGEKKVDGVAYQQRIRGEW